GTNQFVIMMRGYPLGVPANEALSQVTGIKEGSTVTIEPYLMLRNAHGHFVNWVPSTGDLFSTGWKVIE
ncbi:MAG: MW1434 family type I TA system toxin, partial [Methanobacterium sp.]